MINFLLLSLCLSACWFYCYAIYAAITFFRRSHHIAQEIQPGVSILKPICGLDGEAYENLASFCQQDYPEYQIIFAVRDTQDLGIEVVRKIIHDFPSLDIQLVISSDTIGTNLKVSNLSNARDLAKHEILVIADSDIRVGRDYLRRIIQPLQDSSVGVVTCPYRSRARGYAATLEALGSATEFHAGVLVGRHLEGIKFALGSTIVIRKQVLEVIGGFKAIANYLEDDFQLGYLSTLCGYKVVLSDYVVEHVLTTSTLSDSIQRQIRWARGSRVSRPLGYIGLIFTHGTVASLLFVIATGGSWLGWVGLAFTWSTRLLMAWVIGVWSLQDPATKKFLWLIPVRDLMSFALWCYSFMGNSIKWRGQKLKLTKNGQLVLLKTNSQC
ncbi:bacteriohopanetetrol glucosamine biosynthesis glycosyltransferase HpnI [Aetokthonos hydrillicola Thurmond2011]|uniref:Bacteriohopanetetrol glucosamine biosynthesis glycosyltransferase HpnI n=2 Tax=Aetokthonos TaxID=1550243 RepID=A0AAP5IDA1_9CYAN|nr:bacteriohopanetetrol glucosamine biosynthesis glycosyltransferase HpnI [Aetokthonos hydrillicola]MDR9899453.1 bacteriohopanetetrol glucosamine biosynthesis glycosyltransferase HpnI [Aetokthonos hydrillicola Thurmond2011]